MAYQETLVRERVIEAAGGPVGRRGTPSYQAFYILYAGFIALPLIAGLDKFANVLVDWGRYASPAFAAVFAGSVPTMMRVVGVVEICAGLLVAWRPRWGALVVAAWLAGIIVNLLIIPGFYDIALRDFGLLLGALALSRLSAD